MHNISRMAIHDCRQYLLKVLSSHPLGEEACLLNSVEEFTTGAKFGDDVIVLLILEQLIDVDDIRMVQILQDRDLRKEFTLSTVQDHSVLLYRFHCSDNTRSSMDDLYDLAVGSLAEGFSDGIVFMDAS